ncbi:hypothetical protein QQ020_01590 [Fulvivirgaceae bacterium BMA12]|uniref:DUF6602 domain-containing protein n=1 Tax=Agaribacillus aureus TaxID=3051825 RepID=A0ABT8L2K7_9BACT|nr:hypothetical protein [Fulvivirgaceae bacterium BMA12]
MNQYHKDYTESLGANLNSVKSISKFTKNTAVIGQYAEKVVIEFLKDMVNPIKISTGTIIYDGADIDNSPQFDLIVWDANPLPPIFKIDDFGLVPRNSVIGIIEIKRTDYQKGLDHIKEIYDNRVNFLPGYMKTDSSMKPGFLGVVCISENYKIDGNNTYTKLRDDTKNSVVHLIEKNNGDYQINHKGIYELINFVIGIMKNHKKVGKEFSINLPIKQSFPAKPQNLP